MALEIWIPPSARPEPRRVLGCTLCKRRFPWDQKAQFTRHVKACAKRNEDVIAKKVAQIEGDFFLSPADTERYAFERRRAAERKEVHR